ncbi:MAG: terpene cyclase/mutase family protein, partial [Planctomycetota bacterium]|nr:terpene cyclase/mutase family protein [Planctomycetota bacterium]
MNRRLRLLLLAAPAALCLALAPGPRCAGDAGELNVDSPDLTPDSRRAVQRGLEWLAANQNANGSWTCRVGYKLNETYNGSDDEHVCATALACMAFLAAGNTPERGKYARNVARGLDYVLSCADTRTGYISSRGTRMYEHAFATLFLAEVYGMTQREDIREKLKAAAYLIVRSQNKEGGWRYQPTPIDADLSVTVSTLQALRAARNVGISVPKSTIDAAVRYVKACSGNSDGSFSYQLMSDGMTRTSFALTAAGVVALYSAGEYDSREVKGGLQYLRRRAGDYRNQNDYHFFYGHYYAVQAM